MKFAGTISKEIVVSCNLNLYAKEEIFYKRNRTASAI